jgi:hypothetical protein
MALADKDAEFRRAAANCRAEAAPRGFEWVDAIVISSRIEIMAGGYRQLLEFVDAFMDPALGLASSGSSLVGKSTCHLPSNGAEAGLVDLHMRRSSSPGTASATGSKPMMGTSSIRSDR